MKSVCILVQSFYEQDIRVRRKAEALVAAGYSVDVIALQSRHSTLKTYTLNGVNVYTFFLSKKRGAFHRYVFEYLTFFLLAFFKLSALMKSRHYAVIDVNNLPDLLVFASWYAKRKGAKVVFDMHEITPEFLMSKYGLNENNWQVRLAKYVERASIRYADHVLTINDPIRDLLVSRGLSATKSTVITNSVDETLFASVSTSSSKAVARAHWENFVMMYHGTLTRIYGLDIAIEAFGMAQHQMPGAQFWILGDGPEKSLLESLSRDRGLDSKVKFIDTVLPQEVPQWLNRCDVGILPTRRDVFLDLSFSNKLSEYVIMNKAIVSSRLKTIRHYFSEKALAFFEPNNPSDLAEQMVRVYRDAELRVQLANRAKSEYEAIRWDVMKRRYLNLMEEIIGT